MSFDELIIDTQTQRYVPLDPIELSASYASFFFPSGLVVFLLVSVINWPCFILHLYLSHLCGSHLNHFT